MTEDRRLQVGVLLIPRTGGSKRDEYLHAIRQNGKSPMTNRRLPLLVAFLSAIVLWACSFSKGVSGPTASVQGTPSITPSATVSPTATITPTPLKTFLPLPIVEKAATPTLSGIFYEVNNNFSFIPPKGWPLQQSFSGRVSWKLSDSAILYYSVDSVYSGSVDNFINQFINKELVGLPQLNILRKAAMATESGIEFKKFTFNFTAKSGVQYVTVYFLPPKKGMVGFFFQRSIDILPEAESQVDESMKTFSWLFS